MKALAKLIKKNNLHKTPVYPGFYAVGGRKWIYP